MQMVVKDLLAEMDTKKEEEGMAVIMKSFGDEESTLLDRYERLSFEVQLNQAIFGRSLSGQVWSRCHDLSQLAGKERRRSRGRGSGFQKVMKKLLSQILRKKDAERDGACPPRSEIIRQVFKGLMGIAELDFVA